MPVPTCSCQIASWGTQKDQTPHSPKQVISVWLASDEKTSPPSARVVAMSAMQKSSKTKRHWNILETPFF